MSSSPYYAPGEWQRIMEPLFLGWNTQTGKRVFVDLDQRSTHMIQVGRSKTGKTTSYEHMIRQDIRQGRGVCVIDPEGTIYERLRHYCAKHRTTWDRLVLIDPNDDPYRFGLNYFGVDYMTENQQVDAFIQACYRILKQTDQSLLVQFQRWGDAAGLPIATYPHETLTMVEIHRFLTDKPFRDAVLAALPNRDHAVREWQHWEELSKSDKMSAILAVINRASLFVKDKRTEEILGQPSRINWLEAMDRGAIVLVNLHPRVITYEQSQMIGTLLVHQIVAAAMRRPENPRNRPFYVYVDELSRVVTPDFAVAYNALRKRSTPFVVAMQELAQLDLDDRGKLRTAVINSSDVKMVFGMGDPKEANDLAAMMFASEIANDNVLFQAEDETYAIPIAKSRDVEHVSYTTGVDSGSVRGGARGSVRGSGETSGRTETNTYNPETDEILTSNGLNFNAASTRQDSEQESWQDSTRKSESETRAMVTERWTEYEYKIRKSAPVLYTPEQMTLKYAAAILRQDTGQAILKYHPVKPAITIRTPAPGTAEFPPIVASPKLLEECREYVYRRLQIPTAEQARAEIEARQARVLGELPPTSGALPASPVPVLDPTAAIQTFRATKRRRS